MRAVRSLGRNQMCPKVQEEPSWWRHPVLNLFLGYEPLPQQQEQQQYLFVQNIKSDTQFEWSYTGAYLLIEIHCINSIKISPTKMAVANGSDGNEFIVSSSSSNHICVQSSRCHSTLDSSH